MSGHTPGRWEVDPERPTYPQADRPLGYYVRHVETGRIGQVFENCLVTSEEEALANAQLFAAAPAVAAAALDTARRLRGLAKRLHGDTGEQLRKLAWRLEEATGAERVDPLEEASATDTELLAFMAEAASLTTLLDLPDPKCEAAMAQARACGTHFAALLKQGIPPLNAIRSALNAARELAP